MIFLSSFLDVKDVYVNSVFPRTARLCDSLPIECIPLTYDLNGFKSRINRHLLSVGICNLFVLLFLVTLCLVVAVQPCIFVRIIWIYCVVIKRQVIICIASFFLSEINAEWLQYALWFSYQTVMLSKKLLNNGLKWNNNEYSFLLKVTFLKKYDNFRKFSLWGTI